MKKPSKRYGNLSFLNTIIVACVAVAAAGCVSTGGTTSSDLQRVMKISAVDSAFASKASENIQRLGNVSVVTEDDFSELTLILDGRSGVASSQVLSKPKIVGILRKETKPGTYQISYTLIDNLGKTLAKGDVYGVGHEQEGFYPALNDENTAAQTAAMEDALKQLNGQIAKDLALNGFRSVVSSQLVAVAQVAVPVADEVNFSTRQTFYAEGMPSTRLKFLGFSQDPQGQKQALLDVVEGSIPELGTVIYLRGQNQS